MKGYIYAIKSHQTSDIYIGSTIQILSNRMNGHKGSYALWIKNNKKKGYVSSFEIIKYKDAYIKLFEIVEFNSNNQ